MHTLSLILDALKTGSSDGRALAESETHGPRKVDTFSGLRRRHPSQAGCKVRSSTHRSGKDESQQEGTSLGVPTQERQSAELKERKEIVVSSSKGPAYCPMLLSCTSRAPPADISAATILAEIDPSRSETLDKQAGEGAREARQLGRSGLFGAKLCEGTGSRGSPATQDTGSCEELAPCEGRLVTSKNSRNPIDVHNSAPGCPS